MPTAAARASSLPLPALSAFARDVLEGLSAPQKYLVPKYFYDHAGSLLFEKITQLEDYYPTRAELSVLRGDAAALMAGMPETSAVIEFGAGASLKLRTLLQGGARFSAYVPVDISGEFLTDEAEALRRDCPDLAVHPVVADFTKTFALPAAVAHAPRIGFFPGSTIGNFDPPEAVALLRGFGAVLGPQARLIVGADLEKDPRVLERAYDDSEGVTAAFNLNLLTRINRELGADFDLSRFAHRALYNRARRRIEMHLVSAEPQSVQVLGKRFDFAAGETIHTESSYKYTPDSFAALAQAAGWTAVDVHTDQAGLFSVHVLQNRS